jgi:acylphosphatase
MTAAEFRVRGRVQGVGYRNFVERFARRLGLAGWVRNCPDGSVLAHAEGPAERLNELADLLSRGPRFAEVDSVERNAAPVLNLEGFEIRR